MDLNKPRKQRYCQTREESVIQNLLDVLPGIEPYVLDLGAGDGRALSNSQLLIEDRGWSACRIDGDTHGQSVLDPTLHEHRITTANIGGLLEQYEVPKVLGLFCLDIDGMDFHIMHEVLLRREPQTVVFEINPAREPAGFDVVPYSENFQYQGDNYYGASWGAYAWLLAKHGYTCVHQHDALNGYAVTDALALKSGLSTCQAPPRTHYHRPHPNPVWVNATALPLSWELPT
jgi:hypothetical protein